jgi:CheY-like chemotaxis protein/CHASE3 domain sensor protein
MNLTIGTKIGLSFALTLLALIAFGVVSWLNLRQLTQDQYWVSHTVEVKSHLQSLRGGIVRAESIARGYALSADANASLALESAFSEVHRDFEAAQALVRDNPIQEVRLDEMDPLITRRHQQLQRFLEERNPTPTARAEFIAAGERAAGQIGGLITEMVNEEQRLLVERQQKADAASQRTTDVVIYGTVAAFLAVMAVAGVLAQSITRPIGILGQGAAKIGGGDYAHRVAVTSTDEIGRLATLFNRMAAQVEQRQNALAEQDWLQTGLAAFSTLYQGQRDPAALCRGVLAKLAELAPVRRAALYVTAAAGAEPVLELAASYAGAPAVARWARGQGLPGQCWQDGGRIAIEQPPAGYFRIESGLGEAEPACLLLQPAVYEGTVRAVLELGCARALRPAELTLLEQMAASLAIALTTLEASARTEQLLREAQQLSASLQEQTDRLRRSEVQLQEQQEELKQTNEELEQANAEMEQANAEMEEKVNLLAEQKRETEFANRVIEKSREELKEQARQLALSSKYKSDFLANMSHELRTPLNSLMILSKLLADNSERNLTPKQVQYAQTINASGGDLLEMINEVLDLARIEAGAVRLEPGMVTFQELAEFVERSFRHVAATHQLELEVRVAPGLPEAFESDGRRLKQVLKNLLSNAIKFTPAGFVRLSIDRAPAGGYAFAVADSGIGIPADKQQVIFEAFQQADAGTARKYGGTGLGLSISRELAGLLGGRLQVESTPGQGSTFTLTLPATPPPVAAPAPPPIPLPAAPTAMDPIGEPVAEDPRLPDDRDQVGPGDRVLLVIEDDDAFAGLLIEFGRAKRFKVVRTARGRQGLAFAHKLTPAAITLDLRLPDGDGWLVLDRLKHDPRTRHIPIHIISVDEERERGLRQGAVSYLQKPVTKESLDQALQQTLEFISRPIKSLLIVEDDPVQRSSLQALIGNGDVQSEGVGTAAETFAALERKRYDCLVVDLGLPDMNGVKLIREIQRRYGRHAPPVVVYTGRELERDEDTELRLISDSIVIKNVRSPERLLDETALFLHRVQSRLPDEQRQLLEQAQKNDAVLAGKRVLVVDDDVRNIFALTAILEDAGMQVEYAESGQAALDRLARPPGFDAVLMDVMMPEMDGFEAIRRIRAQDRFKQLPIISVTAKAMKGDREKCLEAGASDYITKPVDTEQLRSLLRVWLYA